LLAYSIPDDEEQNTKMRLIPFGIELNFDPPSLVWLDGVSRNPQK
jgi:hypothetical protein